MTAICSSPAERSVSVEPAPVSSGVVPSAANAAPTATAEPLSRRMLRVAASSTWLLAADAMTAPPSRSVSVVPASMVMREPAPWPSMKVAATMEPLVRTLSVAPASVT